MNCNFINIIGRNQASRKDPVLFLINDVEGLAHSLDKDISECSDFDLWENLRAQNWIFVRAIDVYHGKKIDIQCECLMLFILKKITYRTYLIKNAMERKVNI